MLFKRYFEVQALNFGKVLVMLCVHLASAEGSEFRSEMGQSILGLADLYYKLKSRS